MLRNRPTTKSGCLIKYFFRSSEGLGYRSSCSHPSRTFNLCRNQTTSAPVPLPKKKTLEKPPVSPRTPKRLPSAKYDGNSYVSNTFRHPSTHEFVRTFIQAGTVKEIYRAPGQLLYRMTGFCVGGTLISLAGLWAHDLEVYADKRELASWVQIVYSTVCFIFAVLGTYAALRTHGLIRTVSMIPHDGNLFVRVSVRRSVPWIKPKILTVRPTEMIIRGPPNQSTESPIQINRFEGNSRLSWYGYSIKRYFTLDGFLAVNIEGPNGKFKVYKLDTNGFFDVEGWKIFKPMHSSSVKG